MRDLRTTLTQVGPKGECLRCLADLGFLGGSQEPGNLTQAGD